MTARFPRVAPPSPADPGVTPWHAVAVDDVATRLGSDATRGLDEAEVARRRLVHGANVVAPAGRRSRLGIVVAQFRSLIVVLLLAATMVAFLLDDLLEAVAILVVILLNATIGFVTEWEATQALDALRERAGHAARVLRDGTERSVPASELVPGDLVVLEAGAIVPADGRLIESASLHIDEAALTGESVPAGKSATAIAPPDTVLAERATMAFLGTAVTDGRGRMLVTGTGASTEVGRIGALVAEAGFGVRPPLERQLDRIGRTLVVIVLALCAVIAVLGWLRGVSDFWEMLKVGISLAIAAVPEGLPAVATMTLAIGMQRMAKRRALIRRLPAVETLGCTTVICTDKTGTLTRNELTVQVLVVGDRWIDVTGVGHDLTGRFLVNGAPIHPATDRHLMAALRTASLCNDAAVTSGVAGGPEAHGDPTEVALQVAARKAGLDPAALAQEQPRLDEVPFTSERRWMITVHGTPDGPSVAHVKGAPDTVLAACTTELSGDAVVPLDATRREHWERVNHQLAGRALRVLALARRVLPSRSASPDRDLVFLGLVGMIDPLRSEAAAAIATCREAGIRIVMMTGDQPRTAAEIARQLGIDRDRHGAPLETVHARELAGLDGEALAARVARSAVFARVSPEHKLRIVEALQSGGEVVAVTGDGVNDAPALRQADIGVAMGIKGTDVAKAAADMVITDDNFASIATAVEQGRIVYANILRFIHYLFSCNLSEILVVFVAIVLGWPLPLTALQILWLNMVTDVLPAMALALEPATPGLMHQPPRPPGAAMLGRRFVLRITWQGAVLASATLMAFVLALDHHGISPEGRRAASTVAFMTLALSQVVHAFGARSSDRVIVSRVVPANRWLWGAALACLLLQLASVAVPLLRDVLQTTWPSPGDWLLIGAFAVLPLVVVEVGKVAARWRRGEVPR